MSTTLLDGRDACERDGRSPELARRRRGAGDSGRAPRARRSGVAPAPGAGELPAGQAAHTPVLASELLELLDPEPGQLAIDCTFGDGGHARLLAERLGSAGTLVAIDRDPLAEQRFAALAAETACSVRFIRSGYAEALELLAREGVRADIVYFDLGMSSMQVDTRERGFSYSYEAPLDMRMDPAQELSAREIVARVGRAPPGARAARLRRGAPRARDRPRDRAPPRAGADRRPRSSWSTRSAPRCLRRRASPAAIPPSAPSRRCGSPSTTSSGSSIARCPRAWGLLREGGVLAGISFHSLEDRRVKRFLAERARGCICPPDLPVCVCGREPQAALLARRSIVPSAEELARNPRAASARLRAARKLADGAEAES